MNASARMSSSLGWRHRVMHGETKEGRLTHSSLTETDDAEVHAVGAEAYWREAWWFVFFDQASGVHGIAYLYGYPNQKRGALMFGVWKGDRGLHLVKDLNVPLLDPRQMTTLGPILVKCLSPNKNWLIEFDDGNVRARLEWAAISPIYDWEWTTYTGSRHFEQTGCVEGRISVGDEQFEVHALSQRDRAWGPRSFGVVQQCWASRIHLREDLFSHQALITVGGRDLLFGYLHQGDQIAPLVSMDVRVAYGYEGGPPVHSKLRIVDDLGRAMKYDVKPVNVMSTLLATGLDHVGMHTTFSRFSSEQGQGIGHLDHWFSSPDLVRSHQAAKGINSGRLYIDRNSLLPSGYRYGVPLKDDDLHSCRSIWVGGLA